MTIASRPRSAFTLIELLIVISILVILMGLSLAVMASAKGKADKARTVNLINGIYPALEAYKVEAGRYPDAEGDYPGSFGMTENGVLKKSGTPSFRQFYIVNDDFLRNDITMGSTKHNGVLVDAWDNPLVYMVMYPWRKSTPYKVGDKVLSSFESTRYYLCTSAGTSGSSSPVWNTDIGDSTSDTGVTWKCFQRPMVGNNLRLIPQSHPVFIYSYGADGMLDDLPAAAMLYWPENMGAVVTTKCQNSDNIYRVDG